MNCIAIDDEPLALEVIKDFCSKVDFLNLVYTGTNAVDAITLLHSEQIDVLFIDIQMPHITGLEFVKTLTHPPLIIFTTAYPSYALEGFDLNAVDYLVKPIPLERFIRATNKAYELYSLRKQKENKNTSHKKEENNDYLLLKVEHNTVKLNYKDILYIEGLKDYLKVFLHEKYILTKNTIKKIEEKLPSENFIRVHKSFIIGLDKIEKIENNRIYIGEKIIPIGGHYKESFFLRINKYRL